MIRWLGLWLALALAACSGGGEEDKPVPPKKLAHEAATAHHELMHKLHEQIMTNPNITVEELEAFEQEAIEILFAYGEQADQYNDRARYEYTSVYIEECYAGLEPLVVDMTTFRDSLKAEDPTSLVALQLIRAMGVGVYGDLEQLARVYPNTYKEMTK